MADFGLVSESAFGKCLGYLQENSSLNPQKKKGWPSVQW